MGLIRWAKKTTKTVTTTVTNSGSAAWNTTKKTGAAGWKTTKKTGALAWKTGKGGTATGWNMASGWVASQVGATNPTFNLSIALKLASLSDQVYEKTPEETLLCFDEDTVLGRRRHRPRNRGSSGHPRICRPGGRVKRDSSGIPWY